MTTTHTLGYPRIGARRELKKAVEAYWAGDMPQQELLAVGKQLRAENWKQQADAGIDLVPVGDFAWYDTMLNLSCLLGVVPERFGLGEGEAPDLDCYFRMARGRAPSGKATAACEMTKWFDTNYHYIVPEFESKQSFSLNSDALLSEIKEAQDAGHRIKVVLPGPLTYLWLGKSRDETLDKLSLLEPLVAVYSDLLEQIAAAGVEWVQLDEPALVLDLPQDWRDGYEFAYNRLQSCSVKILLASYFGELGDNLGLACSLPVEGLHIDLVRAPLQLQTVVDQLSPYKILSAGVVNGRNIWRTDLRAISDELKETKQRLGDRLWLAPSCSLLHVPVDVAQETELDNELKGWLAFAAQKVEEVSTLANLLEGDESASVLAHLSASDQVVTQRQQSSRVHRPEVQQRVNDIAPEQAKRSSGFEVRAQQQQQKLQLPAWPTTTIGSFPQTADIRRARSQYRSGKLDEDDYVERMQAEISQVIREQETLGLDVLVHGEPERNDMVEYFGELLEGFAFTRLGWVQSYGSRCVKPPIIVGDIARKAAMTVNWSCYAQSLTEKPVKGMLTGPVTILCWSFPREDVDRKVSAQQLALALRDEVADLETAGISVIQIDEPALREGLPLRKEKWPEYLSWAVESFRIAAGVAKDSTQIHTHMCYSEFNDIIEYIAALDADVITIETSRSDMELLDAFEAFQYPNAIGPGVYDIHSPNVADENWMYSLLNKAAERIPVERLWVNPDCGLKTRGWDEVRKSLAAMVNVATRLRSAS
ncbi:5-methyltetrahydropteroyltriglutamate--homocysteine S-methyltransferase [Spongorhabdus nitratireducens]